MALLMKRKRSCSFRTRREQRAHALVLLQARVRGWRQRRAYTLLHDALFADLGTAFLPHYNVVAERVANADADAAVDGVAGSVCAGCVDGERVANSLMRVQSCDVQLMDAVVCRVYKQFVGCTIFRHDVAKHATESVANILSLLRAGNNDSTAAKQEHDAARQPHDEPGKDLGLVRRVCLVSGEHGVQVDGRVALDGGDDVLDAKVFHADAAVEMRPQHGCVPAAGKQRGVLGDAPGNNQIPA